jgi:hypothetical protein
VNRLDHERAMGGDWLPAGPNQSGTGAAWADDDLRIADVRIAAFDFASSRERNGWT